MSLPGILHQNRLPDFEVAVTFLDAEHGGRSLPAHQGDRPDMTFGQSGEIWTIWPEFLRDDGSSYPVGDPVPQSVRANMYVCSGEIRPLVRDSVHVGQRVQMLDGSRPVATGEVIAIKNLPNGLGDDADAAIAFLLRAKAYFQWIIRTAADDTKVANLRELHEILAHLQAAAAVIPAVEPAGEIAPKFNQKIAADLASRIGPKLPANSYRAVFDPLDVSEHDAVLTSIEDDLQDMYADLTQGRRLYDSGKYRDALWHWHFSYYTHWGRHLNHAQSAIWQYLSGATQPGEPQSRSAIR